ncbi:NudC domain-containing protein 1 [Frankliniella fusca]|uniref:NudC domain-containing protein 1 n=1 Tax=Frankliniella fusca TaxID=407009 RepID=A0AAE1H0R7_9NEOP|nr:NudC domain-containing protein 1 [Frankliniella fusca]
MAKARILVDLRPDVKLLDSSFDGYKLSLEPVPIKRSALLSKPDSITPSADQFSFLHTKLFGLHNKLYCDPWTENVYYIDEKWKILCFDSDISPGMDSQFAEVWEVPSHHERQPGHYNLSISFASPDLVVIADGAGTLHIVNTGDRLLKNRNWDVAFSCEPIGEQKGFVILNSQYYCGELHCLLLHISEQEIEGSDGKKSKFASVVDWITIEGEPSQQNWGLKTMRQLVGGGSIDFACLEPSCTALFVASDRPLKFTSDSENPVAEVKPDKKVELKPQIVFSWLQKGDDITVNVPVADDVSKADIKVTATPLSLQISIRGKVVLEGALHQRVDSDLTCWTLSSGKLEIILSKEENGVVWPELIVGCQKGEEIMDPALVEEVHQRLSHLCSETVETATTDVAPAYNSQELEDCDAFPRDTSVLLRLDSKDHTISHQVSMGGHQWLFNVTLRPGAPPALCVRHDVDACVWQMYEMNHDSFVWPITHVGTFLAFGYVQASKQHRKFTVCPPDMSYAAVCDTSRHVYLYRQPSAVGSELRNRSTGRRVPQVAKQQLVQLESDCHVLGCHATSNYLFLLTDEALFKLILK